MPLADALTRTLNLTDASSFRLSGEELWLVTGADLKRAAEEWSSGLERVPQSLRSALEAEHAELARVAHHWLTTFNGSLEARLRGYAAVGRAYAWEFPWPSVAILGVLQVRGGMRQTEALRLFGLAASGLLEVGDWMQDVLRRTNRGIFCDSVPCALWALRCAVLRREGKVELASALLDGPLPPAMDEESRALARGVDKAMQLRDGAERFGALAAMTVRQFDREQAVFTAQMGSLRGGGAGVRPRGLPAWSALQLRLTQLKKVDAPKVERGRYRTRPYVFPPGFDVRDHRQRSEQFRKAFVDAITGSLDDYRVAVSEVLKRWPGGRIPRFDGPTPLPAWSLVAAATPE
jgi:hypothetical protein